MKDIEIANFCADYKMTQPEATIIQQLRDKGFDPDHPHTKAIMQNVALAILGGITMAIKDIEGCVAKPLPHNVLCDDEIEDQDKWIESMKFHLGRLEGMRNKEGLRLGRPWGKVIVRDDDPGDSQSQVFGFVGYELGDSIYLETDERIRGYQIDDYHARKTWKKRNGGPEKPPERSD